MCWYTSYEYTCIHTDHRHFLRFCSRSHGTPCGAIQLVPRPDDHPVPPCPICTNTPAHPWSIIWGRVNGIWSNFSPGEYGFAGGVLELGMVSEEWVEDLEMTIRRINMQKEGEADQSDGESSGSVTPRTLGQQQPGVETSSSTSQPGAPRDGDYFSLSQEDHHQGPHQTLAVYQRQDDPPNNDEFTLIPRLSQMLSLHADRPVREGSSPTTNLVEDVQATAERPPQSQNTRATQRPCLAIRPVPAATAAPDLPQQNPAREAMPPPPRPNTSYPRQSGHARERHFSSLSSMLSTEPTAPAASAAPQTLGEHATSYLGVSMPTDPNSIEVYESQAPCYPPVPPTPILGLISGRRTAWASYGQMQDHDHPQPARAPAADYPQATDLWSIRRARLLGNPQYWVWRAGRQREQEMEWVRMEIARREVDRRERLERLMARRAAEIAHERNEGAGRA